jgi:hypothetical protein
MSWGTITKCYACVHVEDGTGSSGLVGEHGEARLVFLSFWDTEASGRSGSAGGTGKTTREMQTAATFAGWGEGGVWTLDEGRDYPRLAWENKPDKPIITPIFASIAGTGSQSDPYLIYTAEQLNTIGLFPTTWDQHFRLRADVDLAAYLETSFNTIGASGMPFRGVFDGGGHTISNLHYYYRDYLIDWDFVGLVGCVDDPNARIENLKLTDVDVSVEYGLSVGSLIGSLERGTVSGCGASGSIRGHEDIGGLIGSNAGVAADCYASGGVDGSYTCAGDPNSPVGNERSPNGARINMGFYGGTAEAGKSPSGTDAKLDNV